MGVGVGVVCVCGCGCGCGCLVSFIIISRSFECFIRSTFMHQLLPASRCKCMQIIVNSFCKVILDFESLNRTLEVLEGR